jgi:hypothetical protein
MAFEAEAPYASVGIVGPASAYVVQPACGPIYRTTLCVLFPLLRTLTDSGDAAEHYTCTDDASPGTTDDTRASAADRDAGSATTRGGPARLFFD